MRRALYLFIFLFSFGFANAQKISDSLRMVQYRIIQKVAVLKDDSSKIKAIDSLIASEKITHDKYLAGLWSLRADVLYDMYSEQISDYANLDESDSLRLNSPALAIIDTILKDYNKAIETCTFCSPMYKVKQMGFYSTIGNYSLYDESLEDLKKYGLKKEHNCPLTLGVNYIKGKNDWLGFELSALNYIQQAYFLKNVDPADGIKKRVGDYTWPISVSFITVGYNQNLGLNAHEFTFSLLQFTAPFLISLTKFGFLQSPLEKHVLWYYRPEIGFGNSFLSIGYAYNVIFKKSERHLWENSLLVLKITIPTFKLD